jgi:hypothetical protein
LFAAARLQGVVALVVYLVTVVAEVTKEDHDRDRDRVEGDREHHQRDARKK